MKIPVRIAGYVSYNNVEYAYELNEESFLIMLYPPAKKYREDNRFEIPLDIFNNKYNKLVEIKYINIKGMTLEGNNIIFNVLDNPSYYNDFISLEVNWFIYYSGTIQISEVKGFQIEENDVNLFFPPLIALERTIEFNNVKQKLGGISVSSKEADTFSCGSFCISESVEADVEVTAYTTARPNNWIHPISASSCLTTTFSAPCGVNDIIKTYNILRGFFQYITYRKNVNIGNAYLFLIDKNGQRKKSGVLVFPQVFQNETHERSNKQIITYQLLKDHSSKLLSAIEKDQIGFKHLCDSIKDRQNYSSSRVIMIFAEFEREYRNIYGEESRSDEYMEVKNEIVAKIHEHMLSKNGIKRKYVKEILKYINKRDIGFKEKIKKSLEENKEIMNCFVEHKYGCSYSAAIEEISSHMGNLRNGIAHSRLGISTTPELLDDIFIIEELIYAIRLKYISICDIECKKAINRLFDVRLDL